MVTIQGPIRIGKDRSKEDNNSFIKKLVDAGVEVKLPFKATNFKSTIIQKNLNIEGTKKITPLEKVEEEQITEEELDVQCEEMGFTKFRTWAKDNFKVTGRGQKGLIKDILSIIKGEKEPEV